MEARLKHLPLSLLLLALSACQRDLTQSSIIPPAAKGSAAPQARIPRPHEVLWKTGMCHPRKPLPKEGPSSLQLEGECTFQLKGAFRCRAVTDDFYIFFKEPLQDGSNFFFYVNVEHYKGSGDYTDSAEVDVHIHGGENFYRWSSAHASVKVDAKPLEVPNPRRASVTGSVSFATTLKLEADPGTATKGEITVKGSVTCVPGAFENDPII
jgi:hypothetical protein